MNAKKEKLERTLRLSVKQAEEVSSSLSNSFKVLEAVHLFLTEWDTLEGGESRNGSRENEHGQHTPFPDDYLRLVFCRILANQNPAVDADLVREHICSTLRAVETEDCLSILLEFLPAVLKNPSNSDSTDCNVWNERKSRKVKKDINACLKAVFANNENSLSQILQFFSTVQTVGSPRRDMMSPRDVFHFVIGILPKVPERDLHIAIQALMRQADTIEDARMAVNSVRTELDLLEKTVVSDMIYVAIAFDEAIQGNKRGEELFVEEYFVVIEEIIEDQRKAHTKRENSNVHESDMKLLMFDLVMVILASGDSVHSGRILRMTSNCSFIDSGLLSDPHLSKLVELVDGGYEYDTTSYIYPYELNPRKRILGALVDFSMVSLLTPLRCSMELDTKQFFSKVQVLLLRVISALPEDFRIKAIADGLDALDRFMAQIKKESFKEIEKDRVGMRERHRDDICQAIFSLLLALASTQREVLVPFQKRLVDHIIYDSFDFEHESRFLEPLCNVLAKLLNVGEPNDELDFVMICRTLLFSTSGSETPTNVFKISEEFLPPRCIRSRLRGMVLANAVASCRDLDLGLLVTMRKMISKVLVSPYSDVMLLEPRVASYGIKAIRHLQSQMIRCDLLEKESFNVISLVLSHSRVVHYPDESSKQITTKRPNTILAYNDMPPFLHLKDQSMRRRRFRKMIFRFDSFFTNESPSTPSPNWEASTFMVFELIDTYLALGRSAKWNPRAWVFGGIEIPAISSSTSPTTGRERKFLDWMKHNFSLFGCLKNSTPSNTTMGKQLTDLIKRGKTISEKEAIVESASRFTLTLLFAMALSIAVLRNTSDHFRELLDDDCVEPVLEQRKEALQMIHCQFIKIYDLKQRIQSMERLLRNLGSRNRNVVHKKSKRKKKIKSNGISSSTEKTKIQMKAELAGIRSKDAISRLFHSAKYIPIELIWACLTDPSHDAIIVSAVSDSNHDEGLDVVSALVTTRLNYIDHLNWSLLFPSTSQYTNMETNVSSHTHVFKDHLPRCLRIASFLLLKLPLMEGHEYNYVSVESLVKLIAKYLKLLCTMMISRVNLSLYSRSKNDDFVYFFGLFLSVIGSKQPLDAEIKYKGNNHQSAAIDFNALLSLFEEHIRDGHGSITSQLLETLSILAAGFEQSYIHGLIDFHWRATFISVYTSTGENNASLDPPFVLTKVLRSLKDKSEERDTNQIVMKLMKNRFNKCGEKNLYFVHSICRHWALLALSSKRASLFADFLGTVSSKLVEYLKDVNDCSVEHEDGKVNDDDPADDDDGEYIPPSVNATKIYKPSIPPCDEFMALTSSSYPILFDMILRTSVSSIAIFSVPDAMLTFHGTTTASYRIHPIYNLERIVTVYGSLVKLYTDKFHIFPKSILSAVVNSSKYMLDVSTSKVQEYIEWRNNQPVLLPHEMERKVFDPVSTSFLKNLLDVIGIHVIGSLRLLCSSHLESDNALARKIERIFNFVSEISQRYDTGEVQIEKFEDKESKSDLKIRDTPDEFLPSKHSTTAEKSFERETNTQQHSQTVKMIDPLLIRKRKPIRENGSSSIGDYDPYASEDGNSFIEGDEESSLASSGSNVFGVSGDWGQDNDNSVQDDDSEFVVDHFEESK